MNHLRPLLPILALSLAASPLAAQEHDLASLPAQPVVRDLPEITTPLFDEPGDGWIWTLGGDFKASIGSEGLTFVPFLGSTADRNHPLRLVLKSVRVGVVAVPLTSSTPVRDGARISLGHGSLTEHFDVQERGVEQSFVFDELPARDAIDLELAVDTDLVAQNDVASIHFRGERGGVDYSQAVAVDAKGDRLALETSFVDGRIRIRVPKNFVAAASLPLVIDPLLSNNATFTEQAQTWSNSAAYDASLNQYVLTYCRIYSTTDHDCFIRRFDSGLNPLGGALTIDFTTAMWANSHIAGLEPEDRFLVVGDRGNQGDGIVGRVVYVGASVTVSSTIDIAVSGQSGLRNGFHRAPALAGRVDYTGSGAWLVAWQYRDASNHTEIENRYIWNDGTLSPGVRVISDVNVNVGEPAISPIGGKVANQDRFAIVFVRNYLGTLDSVRRVIVTAAGNVLSPDTWIGSYPSSTSVSVSSPTDGTPGSRRFLAVWNRISPINSSDDVYGALFDDSGNLVEGEQDLTAVESSDPNFLGRPQWNPRVDTDGCRFVLTYADAVNFATQYDIWCATFAHTPAVLPSHWSVHDRVALAATADMERANFLCPLHSTQSPQRMLVGWTTDLAGGGYATTLRLYDAMSPTGGITSRATGCGGLNLGGAGTAALGSPMSVTLTNATGLSGILAGLPSASPILGCPGCTLGTTGFAVLGPSVLLTVPCNLTLVGATLSFQGFDTANAVCLGLVRLSNTIDATVR